MLLYYIYIILYLWTRVAPEKLVFLTNPSTYYQDDTKEVFMSQAKDITGQRFGRLTAIKLAYIKRDFHGTKHYWLFKCDCGKECIVFKQYAINGHTQSCGCYKHKRIVESKITHNLSKSRIYSIYYSMIARCNNPQNAAYKNYGGRGITVCQEWKDNFMNFYKWAMANGYTETLTIDRIDVNGNYEPDNCRWVDTKIQGRNKRTNTTITYNGETHCIVEWAEIYNISEKLLSTRLRMGWDFYKATHTLPDEYKNRANKLIEYKGEYKTLKEWLEILQIHSSTFYRRLKKLKT